jgi:hypothetical protein
MIECRHPEGKLWRSMFIATTPTGVDGFSLTWWGKDDQVKGQAQCKRVSEREWYSVVKSKAVSKGYTVENYIGREVPLQVGHEFVVELSKGTKNAALPILAMTDIQAGTYGVEGGHDKIGRIMGKALANLLPTSNFLSNINGKGHSVGALLAQARSETASPQTADVVEGIMHSVDGTFIDVASVPHGVREPEPKIDREEVYGSGWGAFG